MKIITLISHTNQLLRIIVKSSKPADRIASEYFRSKKYIGSKERKFISEVCFHSLRNYNLLDFIYDKIKALNNKDIATKSEITPDCFIVIISLLIWQKIDSSNSNYLIDLVNLQHDEKFDDIESAISMLISENFILDIDSKDVIELINKEFYLLDEIIESGSNPTDLVNVLSIRYSINPFIINSLFRYFQFPMIDLLDSLTKSAKLTLRTNALSARKNIVNLFKEQNINANITKYSPAGISVNERINLNNIELYNNGVIEVQDEGSQLITYALSPSSGSRVLDACAGAGGKSLHIASITTNTTQIIASDIDNRKLNELERRSAKFGFNNIKTVCLNPKAIINNDKKYFKEQFDYILVDAPCSGLGTVRRMPLPKYRLNERLVERLKENQTRILNYYSQFLKSGGILVYSTCSFLPQENQEVVEDFLEQNNNFYPDPLNKVFQINNIEIPDLKENDFYLNLFPSVHNTDGFFMARFKKGDI